MTKFRCPECSYVYDEAKGDVQGAVPPGTKVADLPKGWRCPACDCGKPLVKLSEVDVHAEAPRTVAELVIRELEKWGVEFVFGIPGGSSLGLVDALRTSKKMRYITVRHEENAALAASAYNKLTGKLAACLTIAGPGATNLATGLYDAKEDRASLLSLNGQVAMQYAGPGGFQEIDQDAFFKPSTVFSNTVHDKRMTVKILTMALKSALVQRGPAQVSLPNDVAKEPLDPAYVAKENTSPSVFDFRIMPEEGELRRAAEAINSSSAPVIVAGLGAFGSAAEVLAIAEKIKAPIVTTYRGRGMFPDDSDWYMGILGDIGPYRSRQLASEADLLLVLGVGFSQRTAVPTDKRIVQVDIDPLRIGKVPVEVGLWGNCEIVLPKLRKLLKEREDTGQLDKVREYKREWIARLDEEADPVPTPLRPPFIIKTLSDRIPEDAIVCVDIGENNFWLARQLRLRKQRILTSFYLATMQFALPAAIAAKLAYPERKVVCVTGDGGFGMAMAELTTLVKNDLPALILIMNNHTLAMIEMEQRQEHFPTYATELHNPDFAAYADACGCLGIRVKEAEDLGPAIEKGLASNVPAVLDVETDPVRFRRPAGGA